PLSAGLLGGFWSSTVSVLDAAEIGAAKSGGAGGATFVANDLWLVCEYAPPVGEATCGQAVTSTSSTTSTSTSTTSNTGVSTTSTTATSTSTTSSTGVTTTST